MWKMLIGIVAMLGGGTAFAEDRFASIEPLLPPPDAIHAADGRPGPGYWQQQVDYRLKVRLDEPTKSLTGEAEITYYNHAPQPLDHLWLLVDQNRFRDGALREQTRTISDPATIAFDELARMKRFAAWQGGFAIAAVTDAAGQPLPHRVVDALMRVDLPQPLRSGEAFVLRLRWTLPLIETKIVGGRSGYACVAGPASCVFQLGQWFPRLAVYDGAGWHTDPFLGAGEFALEYGTYDVAVTVPADHVVAATGTLVNPTDVLSPERRLRLAAARGAAAPVMIVTAAEASAAAAHPATAERTWRFHAENVRDFAIATSRRYLWDAMGVSIDGGRVVMAMSFYPDEARPLWPAYATKAMAHTLHVYGRLLFPYPYPVVQAAFGEVSGYENPMLSFTEGGVRHDLGAGRASYGESDKRGLLSTVIHETGHNWFPESVNSDERRDAWMDEGLNSFLQFEAEKQWDPAFRSTVGEPTTATGCMTASSQSLIITRPDYSVSVGCTVYRKPAAALVVLRELVMGREAFDPAFREYARRWRSKRATPADFFRTMEDVSGVDLGWFWRGWFFGTDHVDLALTAVTDGHLAYAAPGPQRAQGVATPTQPPLSLTAVRNTQVPAIVADPSLRDAYDEIGAAPLPKPQVAQKAAATPAQLALAADPRHFYRLSFRNIGGLVSPIPLSLRFADGSRARVTIPVQVWRRDPLKIEWRYVSAKALSAVEIDPDGATGDTDRGNNVTTGPFPVETIQVTGNDPVTPSRMEAFGIHVSPESIVPRHQP